jgi:L-ascorbate 6-phosphate lactonase
MISGPALLHDINQTELPPGQCAFWWLGQHSFVVKLGARVIYLDPFLTVMKERLIPPLLHPAEIRNADLICGSHDHADHIDRPAWPDLAASSPHALFAVPQHTLDRHLAADLKISPERFVGFDAEQTKEICGLRITAIASSHEFFERDPHTGRYPYLGFVIEGHGCRIYHPGDTVKYDGMETRLKAFGKFDLAFLPINGRDARRYRAGILGNMTFQEAADLAGAIAPELTVPAHYDMFEGNLENVLNFRDYMAVKYPRLKVKVCEYGERVLAG